MRKEQTECLLSVKKELSSLLSTVNTLIREEQNQRGTLTSDDVIKEICDYGCIRKDEFVKGSKKNNFTVYRKIACYILTDHLKMTPTQIKKVIGYTSSGSNAVTHHADDMRNWMEYPNYAPKGYYFTAMNIINNLGL